MNMEKRTTALDAVRITACFLVCSVHFFLNSYYYSYPLTTTSMVIFTIFRSGCMVCVPLFLVLTGYLMNKKKASLRYYWGLEKTLLTYVLSGAMCMLYKKLILETDVRTAELLNFTAAPYAWYVEMYIGLFLLIPFLNLIWNGLSSKKQKQGLLLTLIILTALPSVVNIFKFDNPAWWLTPSTGNDYLKIMPSWWQAIYPLTYYFIGAYLKEYPINAKKSVLFLLIIANTTAFGVFCYYRSRPQAFVWGEWQNWGALPILIGTVLVFSFITSFNLNTLPRSLRKTLALVSDLCLGTYLLSWIADSVFYRYVNTAFPDISQRLTLYFVVPIVIFCTATVLSAVIYLISKLIHKLIPIEKLIFKEA